MRRVDRSAATARDEAKILLGLVRRNVSTPADVRDLIAMSPTDEQFLRRGFHPNLVRQLIEYRGRVLAEFENMLADGTQVPGRHHNRRTLVTKFQPLEEAQQV